MARFMVLIKANSQSEAGVMPSEQAQADMTAYNEELVHAGVRLAAEGLQPSSKGARVYFRDGATKVVPVDAMPGATGEGEILILELFD